MRERLALVLTLVFFAGSATSARGQGAAAPDAQTHLERGHQMMDDLEYLNAVHEYSLVLTDDQATLEQQQQARLHAGMAHRYMENDVEARMLFLAALKRDPSAKLPPRDHPPKLVTFFELVREEAAPAATRDAVRPDHAPAPSGPPAVAPEARARSGGGPNWGAITGSAALLGTGLFLLSLGAAIDALLYFNPIAGSGDQQLDVIDFSGPAVGVAGAAVALAALALIPWWFPGAAVAEEAP